MMKSGNSGQALIESTLLILPMSILILTLFLIGYISLANEWGNYWNYRASLCMVKKNSRGLCQRELEDKLSLLLIKDHYQVKKLWKTPKEAIAETQIKVPLGLPGIFLKDGSYQRRWLARIPLPLANQRSVLAL